MALQQSIEIVISAIDRATEPLKKVKSQIDKMNEGLEKQRGRLTKAGNISKKYNTDLDKMKKNQMGVLMSGLGTMFMFQGLQKAIGGLLDPALESLGVFDLFGTVLEMLFLPVGLKILDFVISLLDFVSNIPDDVKLAIGTFVVFATILTAIGATVASLAIGITALITAVASAPAWIPIVATLAAGLMTVVGLFGTDIANSVGKAINSLTNFKVKGTNEMNVFGIDFGKIMSSLPGLFDGAIKMFSPILEFGMKILKGDWKGAWEDIVVILSTIWNKISDFLKNIALPDISKITMDGISTLMTTIGNSDLWKNTSSLFHKVINYFIGLLTDPSKMQSMLDAFNAIISYAVTNLDVGDLVSKLVERIRSGIKEENLFNPRVGIISSAIMNMSLANSNGSRAYGGDILSTGMYRLHKGESVVPAGETNNWSGTVIVNVDARGNNGVDSGAIEDAVSRAIAASTKRRSLTG